VTAMTSTRWTPRLRFTGRQYKSDALPHPDTVRLVRLADVDSETPRGDQ
jgi:hypothetical protein